jgi:hypothetical protein
MDSAYTHEFQVSFYVFGGVVHPSEITEQLQIEPDLIHEMGSLRNSRPERPAKTYQKHLWRFSSLPTPSDEPNVQSHIEFILQAIEPHSAYLLFLAKDAELYLEVDCRLDERFRSTSYEIDRSLLARLVKLQVSMGHVFRLAKNERVSCSTLTGRFGEQ